MKQPAENKGSVIIFTILILAIILSVTFTMARIFVPKIRAIADSVNSGVAIFAADSLSEACLYEARKQPAAPINRSSIIVPGVTYNIASLSLAGEIDIGDDCRPLGAGSFKFRATAEYRGVSRALEISQ